ncbi:MAG: type II secretion system protein [Glaciimonas sp.]|nr:type II secretion system protein [Glaciimonas sp.]
MSTKHRQRGISLIELIMFIVIVSVGIAGILSVMNVTTKASADPLIRKQALAIAESLLEEIELQPFTYCDPGDAKALTAVNAADCAVPANSEDGLPAAARVSNVAQRDAANVADYNNFAMTPIRDISGTQINGLAAYSVSVAISQVGDTFAPVVAKNDVLQIDVRVVSGNTDITLTGYRFRYAPNALP